jgi:glycosyltransferase involved in cell wall biosynthesis
VIVSFVNPRTHHRTGGVVVLYRFANALAELGHEIQFFHRREPEDGIPSIDGPTWFPFDPRIEHVVVDSLDDPGLPPADVILSPLGASRLGEPAVFIQGYQMVPLELERAAYRTRGPKICVARWLVDVGREFGVPEEQLWHVPMGVDHDVFSVRTPLDERPYDVALLFNPHPQKGWAVGRLALAELRARRPGLRAVAFGNSTPGTLPSWVEFREALDHEGLADQVYNATRVFVQSSYVEGFGLTAVEAMACGAALVTTDNGGAGDYAVDDDTALVVPPADPVALADAIEALLADDDRRLRIAGAGERFVRRFTWERAATELEERLVRYVDDPRAYQRPPADDGGASKEISEALWRSFVPE